LREAQAGRRVVSRTEQKKRLFRSLGPIFQETMKEQEQRKEDI
jgi:hypothetical protein